MKFRFNLLGTHLPVLNTGQADASRPVKTKMTELRENCDHLLTQIGNIKAASNQSPPDVKVCV